jgi:hypothetical protein
MDHDDVSLLWNMKNAASTGGIKSFPDYFSSVFSHF